MLVVLPAISWKEKILWIKNYLLSFCTLSWYGANLRTTTFFQLTPFRSPLTHPIYFGEVGKLLTSATRTCSPLVDSVSHAMPKKSVITCWAPMAACFGQSASTTNGRPQRSQTANSIDLPWSVQFAEACVRIRQKSSCRCRGLRPPVAYFIGSNGCQWNPRVSNARARSREWSSSFLRQATSKKYAYAGNLRIDKPRTHALITSDSLDLHEKDLETLPPILEIVRSIDQFDSSFRHFSLWPSLAYPATRAVVLTSLGYNL